MKTNFHLALCQMPVTADKEENLKTAAAYVAKAKAQGAQVVVLPEMFCCPYNNDSFVANREARGGSVYTALADAARKNNVVLIGGSMPEEDDGKIYNTCFVFDGAGNEIARHRKMHLFDIDVKGGQYFKESDTFTAGNDVTVVDTPYGKIGVAICFDIRFPELARMMQTAGATVLVYPGAFNMTTGPAHWEVTGRARAVDNQCYVAMCCQSRDETASYVAYGHSMIITPWGAVASSLEAEAGIVLAEIDPAYVADIRAQLPLILAARTDVYRLPETV